MAAKGSRKGKGKATARAKLPTSVINQHLSLDWERIKVFIPEHICELLRIYHLSGVMDQMAWDLLYDIFFLDTGTTRQFSHFQLLWPPRRSRSSLFFAVVSSPPVIYGASVWQNPQPNKQLEVGQPPCLWGSSQSLQSAANQLGKH